MARAIFSDGDSSSKSGASVASKSSTSKDKEAFGGTSGSRLARERDLKMSQGHKQGEFFRKYKLIFYVPAKKAKLI